MDILLKLNKGQKKTKESSKKLEIQQTALQPIHDTNIKKIHRVKK